MTRRKKCYLSGKSCRGKGKWNSSARALCPSPASCLPSPPSSGAVPLLISGATWTRSLLKPTGLASCSKCTLFPGGSTPHAFPACTTSGLLLHYRALCPHQWGRSHRRSCLCPIPESHVDHEVIWKRMIYQPQHGLYW